MTSQQMKEKKVEEGKLKLVFMDIIEVEHKAIPVRLSLNEPKLMLPRAVCCLCNALLLAG